jgi:hypothetical protein
MKFILLLSFICSLSALANESLRYDSLKLQQMPAQVRVLILNAFKKRDFRPVFTGKSGSKVLKLNLLISDPFMSSKIAVKYGVSGNYQLGKTYPMNRGFVYHQKINQKEVAFYFEDVSTMNRDAIINSLASIKVTKTFSLIETAHADSECLAPNIYPSISLDTAVVEGATGSILSNCMSGLLSGAEESTVGVVQGFWNGIKSEYKTLKADAGKRLGEYWNFVSDGAKQLWSFAKTLGMMLASPTKGIKVLKQKFGEIGDFFVKAYEGVAALPANDKAEMLCNILGSIGVDVLITAITVGAGGAKLAIGVTRVLLKLKKIASILGKGLKVPFKVLEKLSDKTIDAIKKISGSKNQSYFEKRLKEVGCAI